MTKSVVHQIDAYGAFVQIQQRSTPTGRRADQVTVQCPQDHPTGVTVTMLQGITAAMLRADHTLSMSFDEFMAGLTPSTQWSPGKRNRTTDKLLTEVAAVYTQALAAQHPPLQVVARWLGSSIPTASQFVREARRRRLITEMPRPGRPMKKN